MRYNANLMGWAISIRWYIARGYIATAQVGRTAPPCGRARAISMEMLGCKERQGLGLGIENKARG